MTYQHQAFPSWRYGPNGASVIVNSEDETPKGYEDHPTKVKGAASAPEGTKTARASANGSISEAGASKTRTAKSQTAIDPAKAAANTGGGVATETKAPAGDTAGLDAHGHAYDPAVHAGTGSKTKDGLWRMKVGVARPAAKEGYPLDL